MSKIINEHLLCEFCDGTTETKYISKTFKRKGQEFTFHNIQVELCPKCGEFYYDGKILMQIEIEIKQKINNLCADN